MIRLLKSSVWSSNDFYLNHNHFQFLIVTLMVSKCKWVSKYRLYCTVANCVLSYMPHYTYNLVHEWTSLFWKLQWSLIYLCVVSFDSVLYWIGLKVLVSSLLVNTGLCLLWLFCFAQTVCVADSFYELFQYCSQHLPHICEWQSPKP